MKAVSGLRKPVKRIDAGMRESLNPVRETLNRASVAGLAHRAAEPNDIELAELAIGAEGVTPAFRNGQVPPAALLGESLRWLRNACRLSQEDLARKAGIAAGYVSQFERGDVIPKAEQIAAIHGALVIEAARLLEGLAVVIRETGKARVA